MGASRGHGDFGDFVAASRLRLLRLAVLLAGSPGDGEDPLQGVYTRMYPRWRSIRDGDPDAYARRALANASVSRWRRHRNEVLVGEVPERVAETDDTGRVVAWIPVARALARLPANQRTVVVLRYYADQSERDVAATLGIPAGTVKSLASRGIAALRQAVAEEIRA